MRNLVFALEAAGVVMFNVSGYSAEESAVKSRPDPNRPGRTLEEAAGN